ncbi:UDP-glucose 4-epimerase GalE [Mesorhizobium sp. ZC-5]|uniref:UDP-glucose 4-epimerase GalE n=1 Tax=Mesorhizobium sp. ZC-5 TaxID=2986066 RepID=UPI0021E71CC8|nr:UDP-glucose 4-epimerase GalE [Mesorhizobium sp. ZC-5]MCV3240696.1 UDP-glucose 4-epimerase GalE [Mesorhizobium sp. ZC-5]
MTVLVTGGAGYIGSHMVWELLDAGEDVVVLDRLSTGFEWAVAPEAKLVVGDVGDIGLVSSIIRKHKVDAVIHFAGSIVVPESVADPLGYYENNTSKTRSLLEAVVRENVPHFIFSSTAAVYGGAGLEPVREDAPLKPESPYGVSKLMTEWMLRDTAAAHGLRYTALRYFNVSGADPRGRTGQSTPGATHLIKVACETATGKRPWMQVYGTDYPTPDGTCIRDYIHVSDLVAAHRLALARLRAGGDSLTANCGYSHGYSVLEVIDSVRRVHGADFDVRIAARRPGDAPAVIANSELARQELGWRPIYDDLDRIVADALNWEKYLQHTASDSPERRRRKRRLSLEATRPRKKNFQPNAV